VIAQRPLDRELRDADAAAQQLAALERAHDCGLIDDRRFHLELAVLLRRRPVVVTKANRWR